MPAALLFQVFVFFFKIYFAKYGIVSTGYQFITVPWDFDIVT